MVDGFWRYFSTIGCFEVEMSENLTVLEILEALERGETLTEEQVRPLEWAIGESIGYRWLTDVSDTNKSMLVAPDIAQRFILTGQFIDGRFGQPTDQFSLVKPNWFNTFFLTSEVAWAIVEKWMIEQDWWIHYSYCSSSFFVKDMRQSWEVWIGAKPGRPVNGRSKHRLTAACLTFAKARGLGSP